MKKILRVLGFIYLVLLSLNSQAQCGAGYNQAQLNWDMLDYYYNSGSNVAPYGHGTGNYITNALEQTQRFAIGRNYVTITTPAAGIVDGENTTHTGEVAANYLGADAQFTPTAGGQIITLTFNTEVQNLQLTLYDVDLSQRIDFTALNAASVAQNINVVTYGGTILTVNNNNATNARITANATGLANNSNAGTATITVSASVKTFRFTISTVGTDAVFWLSDINACVNGSFPNNYQQTGNNRPLQGPAGNQPDYFLVTPDNQSVYMVDPATGNATRLFTDASNTFVNSLGYDPYNHILYYISESDGTPSNPGNKTLKKYDFNTGTSSILIADVVATLGIPTFDQGLESAGAAFYDGALYLGIEGGRYSSGASTITRETLFWRIDLDASLNPTVAYQVFATDAYQNGTNTTLHDFGDFILKNGTLYAYNTARTSGGNYAQSKYHHYNLTTGAMTVFNNPGTTAWNGQAGMGWSGNLYYFRNTTAGNSGIGTYDGAGNNGAPVNITVIDGTGAWPAGNGDASENFRPQVDFGDAPASYDPNPLGPASHAQNANLRLGSNLDKEWVTKGQTALANSDSYDDATPYTVNFVPQYGVYLTEATVYNNTGANATVCAWLDYNGNGVFDAAEGISVNVPTNAAPQMIYLYWPSITSSLTTGTYTYLRIRVTSASNGMTTANATGYYNNGEVEDFRVAVNAYPLAVQQTDFAAELTGSKTVKLNWSSIDESKVSSYAIEKSANSTDWKIIHFDTPKNGQGTINYEALDQTPFEGISYYRLRIVEKDGQTRLSNTRKIEIKASGLSLHIAPNPASSKTMIKINSPRVENATLELYNNSGVVVYRKNIHLMSGSNSIELPVSSFVSGRYIVKLTSNTKSLHQSLIVNK